MEKGKEYFSRIIDSFEEECELTEFLGELATEESGDRYELVDGFVNRPPAENKIGEAFADVTSIFMTAGFAIGYIYGQNSRTPKDVVKILDELKKRMKEEGLPVSPKSKKS